MEGSSSEEEEEETNEMEEASARPRIRFRPESEGDEDAMEGDCKEEADPEYEPEDDGGEEEPALWGSGSDSSAEEFSDPDEKPRRKRARPMRSHARKIERQAIAVKKELSPRGARRVASRREGNSERTPLVTGKRVRWPNQLFAHGDMYPESTSVERVEHRLGAFEEQEEKEEVEELPLVPIANFRNPQPRDVGSKTSHVVPSTPGQMMHPYFCDPTKGFHSNKTYARYRSLREPLPDMPKMATQAPEKRTQIWNRVLKYKVTGNAAPLERNLEKYLRRHPDCEVYMNQDNMSPWGGKIEKLSGGNEAATTHLLLGTATAVGINGQAAQKMPIYHKGGSSALLTAGGLAQPGVMTRVVKAGALQYEYKVMWPDKVQDGAKIEFTDIIVPHASANPLGNPRYPLHGMIARATQIAATLKNAKHVAENYRNSEAQILAEY